MSDGRQIEPHALLTVGEMSRADAAAIGGGVSGETLMEAAGAAVVDQLGRRWSRRPVVVLCGPGKNGGDGFVVARRLARLGWPVRLALAGRRERLTGDAAINAARWQGGIDPFAEPVLDGASLVVDAIFGAGLDRAVDGAPAALIDAVKARRLPCVAVDMPSGVQGDSGAVLGTAPQAALTVTFFRRKPGHVLLPGRALAGEVVVADIGIPDSVLTDIAPRIRANAPALWAGAYPWPGLADHKYSRGHAVIAGGRHMTGAARLAAHGARRVGAGLVTIAAAPEVLSLYAAAMAGLLTEPAENAEEFAALIADARKNAVLVGPGGGVTRLTRDQVLAALGAGKRVVLDADALTVFQDEPAALFAATRGARCLMTPHEGEFARLFAQALPGDADKVTRTRGAAAAAGCAVLLKGADTVIAAPDGSAVINADAASELATAGAGDVLAGFALGLMAQGMAPFEAGCAAAWLHGRAAREIGPGLIAEDLPDALPAVLRRLREVVKPSPMHLNL